MRKKLSLIALVALVFGLWGLYSPAAQAVCGDNDEDVTVDEEGVTEEEAEADNVASVPGTGSQVYQDDDGNVPPQSGYFGIQGGTGYAELGGDNGSIAEGALRSGALSASVKATGVCVNDTNVPS